MQRELAHLWMVVFLSRHSGEQRKRRHAQRLLPVAEVSFHQHEHAQLQVCVCVRAYVRVSACVVGSACSSLLWLVLAAVITIVSEEVRII